MSNNSYFTTLEIDVKPERVKRNIKISENKVHKTLRRYYTYLQIQTKYTRTI